MIQRIYWYLVCKFTSSSLYGRQLVVSKDVLYGTCLSHTLRVSRSSPQDILTLFGTHSMSLLA